MKTIIVKNKGSSQFDDDILELLDLSPADSADICKEHIRIGVRNEYHLIYREIGVTQLADFLKVVDTFERLGFVDEFGQTFIQQGGYDAIFSPGPKH